MKFLIGLGSMGKRRIRNLKYLGYDDIIGVDISEERSEQVKEYKIKITDNVDSALNQNVDAVIISTPPENHYDIANHIIDKKIPFFMEANVIPKKIDKIVEKSKTKDVFYAPSCTMRHNKSIKKIREIVKSKLIGDTLHFMYYVGQYLPDWHKYEDFRSFYVSKKETGGNNNLELDRKNYQSFYYIRK